MKPHIIMILTNAFDPDVRVYKEAVYLISRGFSVTILCWDKDKDTKYPTKETIAGIKVRRFRIPSQAGTGRKQIPAYLKFIDACRAYLKRAHYEYLHCNDLDGAVVGYLVGKRGIPYVFDMHEFYECGSEKKRTIIRAVVTYLIRHSQASLYENDVYLSELYASVQDKLVPLKNYPDSSLVRRLPKSESDVFRIGYHGGVRNQVPQFRALFEAVKDHPDIRVDVNGLGIDYQKLLKISEKYPNVHINGAFDGTKELTALYEKTDVLYCGYNPENPNMQKTAEIVKYYEAILTGTPMIATESLAVGQNVSKNGFGIACDTLDSAAIEKAVLAMKNDQQLREWYSKRELDEAPKYDWKEAVRILDRVYIKESAK